MGTYFLSVVFSRLRNLKEMSRFFSASCLFYATLLIGIKVRVVFKKTLKINTCVVLVGIIITCAK